MRYSRIVALTVALGVSVPGCAPRAVSCDGTGACGSSFQCVPRPCPRVELPVDAADRSPEAEHLRKAGRVVLGASEVAVIESGEARPGALPTAVTFGRAGDSDKVLLLRFAVPRDVDILAAYLVVDRADLGGSDGAGVGLHAERIVGPWSGWSTWTTGPSLVDEHGASIALRRGGPVRIRIDASFLSKLPVGEPLEGVALVADRKTRNGVALTVVSSLSVPLPGDPSSGAVDPLESPRAPRLELYVK